MLVQNVLSDIFKTSIDTEGIKLTGNIRKAFPNSIVPAFKTDDNWEFSSKKISTKDRVELPTEQRCVARVWGGPCGSQCTRRFASGSVFCSFHGKQTNKIVRRRNGPDGFFAKYNWEVHGRVDKEFEARNMDGELLYSGKIPWWMPSMKDEVKAKKNSKNKSNDTIPDEKAKKNSKNKSNDTIPDEKEDAPEQEEKTAVVPPAQEENTEPSMVPLSTHEEKIVEPKNKKIFKKKKKAPTNKEEPANEEAVNEEALDIPIKKVVKRKKKKKVVKEPELDELDELDEL